MPVAPPAPVPSAEPSGRAELAAAVLPSVSGAAGVHPAAQPAEDEIGAERVVVEQPLEVQPKASQSDRPRSRAWAILGVTVAVLVLALGTVGVWAVLQTGAFDRHAPRHVAPAPSSVRRTAVVPVRAAAQAAPAAPAVSAASFGRLSVAGLGSGSWLEVRRGSAHGHLLFSGLLTDGKHMRFQGRRLWVMFGAATNLAISVDGRREPLQGTVEGLITGHGLTAP